jgi:hypothetical protein
LNYVFCELGWAGVFIIEEGGKASPKVLGLWVIKLLRKRKRLAVKY